MTIDTQKVVSVNYKLTAKSSGEKEEQHIETTREGEPFVFLFGNGGLIEGFENNLRGKSIGDRFDFYIEPAQGYGESHIDNIVNIPIQSFHDEDGKVDYETIKVGNTLPMTDSEGHHLQGNVLEVTADHVRMDFNHPLAGKQLHFAGEVLSIREASQEEIAHGHVHGEGGHHH